MSGDLTPERISAGLRTRRLGRPYRYLVTCASTSDEAMAGEDEGLLVVADSQSGGRGRLGRVWHSPPGENLYLSLLLRPAATPAMAPPLTLLVGAVLAEVVAAAGLTPRLKWPNDLLLDTPQGARKAAGVLTEMASERDRIRHLVVGVGINVNGIAFPPELAGRATSLRLATGRVWDRGRLLLDLIDALEPAYDRFLTEGPADALARWRAHAPLGHRVRVDTVEGTALDVDPGGALLVRDDTGRTHRIVSGELR